MLRQQRRDDAFEEGARERNAVIRRSHPKMLTRPAGVGDATIFNLA